MKKLISIFTICILLLTLWGCNGANKKADETSAGFIEGVLFRDEEKMCNHVHPDYKDSAIPNDEFYKELSDNHFFKIGNELTLMEATSKSYIEDTSFHGDLMECRYVVRTNELFYDFAVLILDNDNGYGVVAVSAKLNTDPTYYQQDKEN